MCRGVLFLTAGCDTESLLFSRRMTTIYLYIIPESKETSQDLFTNATPVKELHILLLVLVLTARKSTFLAINCDKYVKTGFDPI
jgi:hypothetical protein